MTYKQILSFFDILLYKFNLKIANSPHYIVSKNPHYIVSNNFKSISIVKPALTNKLTAFITKRT